MRSVRARVLWVVAVGALGAVIAATGLWRVPWESLLAAAREIHHTYGVDVPLAALLFGLGEALFCLSAAMMLREAGSRVSWKAIRSFSLKRLDLGNRRMLGWLWVNRAAWIAPWLVVLGMSVGRVPWWVTGAGLAEVAATFAVGVLLTAGLRLPWWNERGDGTTAEQSPTTRARLRVATPDDAERLAELERDVWGEGAASAEQLRSRIANCPEGNIVAVAPDGRFCGLTSYCLLDYDRFELAGHTTWNDLSGNGTASTHDPKGPDLFGINLGVTGWAPRGTSVQLLAEVVRAGVRARVRKGLLGARMPGYHRWADRLSAHEYWVAERRPGVPLDPELRYYYGFGLRPVRLVSEYFEDPASLNWGVIVQMVVPWYLRLFGPALAGLPIDLAGLLARIG